MRNFTSKGLNFFKLIFVIALFSLNGNNVYSQYSTKHYIAAAPWDYSSNANEFVVSTVSAGTASVTITKSDGTAITTLSVTSGSPVAFRPNGNPALMPANAINTKYNDRGLIFTSNLPIAVSVRNVESDAIGGGNPNNIKGNSSLSSYGNEAIGSSFRVGYYRSDYSGLYAYSPAGFPAAAAAPVYSVMAIDNNTIVSRNGTVLVTLNAGQSYLFQTTIGSLITASKPVVMNSGQWRDVPTGCGDAVLNEIPPIRVLGKNYLVVRGNGTTRGTNTGTNYPEQTLFIATEDNTTVTVNTVDTAGAITATNTYVLPTAGSFQNIFHGIDGVKYSASVISADKKIMVYSGTAENCEVDMACVAPVSACTGSFRVETKKFTKYDNNDLPYFGYVLVNDPTAVVNINGSNLETLAGARTQIGTSGFYRIGFTNINLLNPTDLIFSSTVRMSVSMVQQGGGFSMASYLSSFNDEATQQFSPALNGAGCVTLLTAEPGLEPYQWYLNDVLIPGAISQTYVPTSTGSYSVAGTKSCGLSVASTPISVDCIPIDAVDDGSAVAPFATVISGTTLATSVKANDFIDGTPVTATNTIVTAKTQGPLSINAAGIITVASGTVNGVYSIDYELCSTLLSPTICDIARAYVKVTVLAGSVSANQTLCSGGDPALFTSTASGVGEGTISYRWESSVSPFTSWTIITGASSATYDAPAGLTATTRYRRIAISSLGESDPTTPVIVTINAKPTSALSGTTTICNGASTNLSVALTGSQPWSLTYTDGTTPVNITGITASPYLISVSPTSTKTYSLTAVSDVNCTGTSFTGTPKITVNAKPTSVLSGAASICNGASTNLSIALTGVQPWSLTYTDGTTPVSVTGITSSPYLISVSPTSTKTYSINALSDVNCTGTSFTGTPTVTVNVVPTTSSAGLDQRGSATCGLTSVTLGGNTPTIGTGKWTVISGTGGSFALDTDPTTTFSGTAGTAYTLRWTISNAPCATSTDDVDVNFNTLPTATITGTLIACLSTTLTAVTDAASPVYIWYKNNTVIAGETASKLVVTADGDYKVKVTESLTGCEQTSGVSTVKVSDTTAPVIPTLADATGQCSVTPTAPTTTDNCSGTITGTTATAFPITTQGTTVVTWSFDDGNGQVVTADQNIIVDGIVSAVTTVTQPTCEIGTGTISVTVQNATDTYSFDNGSTFQSSNIKSNLLEGSYNVIIRNLNGCESNAKAIFINAKPDCPPPSATIVANNDDARTIDGSTASSGILNVLSNDTLNGLPIQFSDVNISLNPNPNFTIGNDGLFNSLANIPGGNYILTYNICEKANPGNCSTGTVTIFVNRPSIALVKTAHFNDENGDNFAQAGETITYSFEITNTGNVPLTNITITDPLPGVKMFGNPITLGIGQSDNTNFKGEYSIKQSDINLGSISNQATVYGTTPQGLIVEDKSDDSNLVNDNPTVLAVSGCLVTVFNAVEPNGSGLNTKFFIQGLECYSDNRVEIYNRWGVLVFERDHYDNSDDTAFKGISEGRVTVDKSQELPVGTYFYILKYKDSSSNAFEKSGYLYLNRK